MGIVAQFLPFPMGCSFITVPEGFYTNGYWLADLFLLSQPIAQLNPMMFFRCIAEL